jgi:hypothetical protein
VNFREFDILLTQSEGRSRFDINTDARAFVEAIDTALSARKTQAPWRKLYVDVRPSGTAAYFQPALPKVGLSAAGAVIGLTDPAILATTGNALRPLLASTVLSSRAIVRDGSGWDDPWFWDLIERTGAHVGPFRQELAPVTDRKTQIGYFLRFEWDEDGTRLYLDAQRKATNDVLIAHILIGDYAGQWGWFDGQVPSKVRLIPGGIELLDSDGLLLHTLPRPA